MFVFGLISGIVLCYIFRKILGKKKEEVVSNDFSLGENIKSYIGYPSFDQYCTFEYDGEGQLPKIKRRRKNDFLELVEKLEKNINKGKLARSNCKSLTYYVETVIPKNNLKTYEIMRKAEDTLLISLEELNFIKEEFLKNCNIDKFNDKYYNDLYDEDCKKYNDGKITKEELEKRRRYYYGDEEN